MRRCGVRWRRPFLFLTNGYEVYFLDEVAGEPRRRVGGFFSQADLLRRMARRPGQATARQSITAPALDDRIAGRPYQRAAVLAFCQAAERHQRRMLLVQATGTGKTRVAISIVDVLTRYNWAKHILFLADRTALVKQAKTSFTEFFKHRLTLCNLLENTEDPATSHIVFSTYPTMLNAIDHRHTADGRPQIAVSVDKLDTGVDVPAIVNLVFFKKVHSYSKFWQMIGRGTRLCPNLFGPGRDKEYFLIFDYAENFAYFAEVGRRQPTAALPLPLSARVFLLRARAAKCLQGATTDEEKQLHAELVQELQAAVTALDPASFVVRQHRRAVEKYRQPYAFHALSDLALAELQRHIAPLVRDAQEVETVRRFDHLMLTILCGTLEGQSDAITRQIAAVQETANLLAAEHLQAILARVKAISANTGVA